MSRSIPFRVRAQGRETRSEGEKEDWKTYWVTDFKNLIVFNRILIVFSEIFSLGINLSYQQDIKIFLNISRKSETDFREIFRNSIPILLNKNLNGDIYYVRFDVSNLLIFVEKNTTLTPGSM